ncbi:MAG: polyprenyl synthetase family protein [Gammaproteobacteria bacterium]|nr:MAG: polyprenyl synthetase family protein [Gammaproteobacteria bacterium]
MPDERHWSKVPGHGVLQALASTTALGAELTEALERYWSIAGGILEGSSVRLNPPDSKFLHIESNLFSLLFLYSYFQAGIPASRRVFYAAVNQCLRGMVTGCDNLLDDEYKKTLDTDLPPTGTRFRSVLDIMVSDRVLFELLSDARERGEFSAAQLKAASSASLHGLLASGAEEAGEEAGVSDLLAPGDVLHVVHHSKTGLLFQCPWSLPALLEDIDSNTQAKTVRALYHLGIGCQVLDDMVDLAADLRIGRHNYVASLIYHESGPDEHARLRDWLGQQTGDRDDADLLDGFPRACEQAVATARGYLDTGTRELLTDEHRDFAQPLQVAIIERIGAGRFLPDTAA